MQVMEDADDVRFPAGDGTPATVTWEVRSDGDIRVVSGPSLTVDANRIARGFKINMMSMEIVADDAP